MEEEYCIQGMGQILYKYRSLENYKNFVDIIINQRLYAANYKDLNDPMEGQFIYSFNTTRKELIEEISRGKDKRRILSLSKNNNHPLMWAHYANGHRGVAIGVELKSNENLKKICYSEDVFEVSDTERMSSEELAEKILTQKHSVWTYEEEYRVFQKEGKFVPVEVKEIILGSSMSKQDKSLVSKLIRRVEPRIEIINENKVLPNINL